jgi:hypothetical protein
MPYAVTPCGATYVMSGIAGGLFDSAATSTVVGATFVRNRLPRSTVSFSRPDCAA